MLDISVLYDSCVLYPAPLRDLLMHLAMTDLYRAKWSNQIHDEWIRNVLSDRQDLTLAQLERTRDRMNMFVRDALVDGYQYLIPRLTLPDPNDRHVLAAALKAKCSLIITFNLKDFPKKVLNQYAVEARHPDHFISHLIDEFPEEVCTAVQRHRLSLKNPPKKVAEYIETLKRQSLPEVVGKLKNFIDHI